MYARSYLYSGDKARACTGLAKLRSVISFGSTRDDTQIWPSMDEVAMWMEFADVGGTAYFGL